MKKSSKSIDLESFNPNLIKETSSFPENFNAKKMLVLLLSSFALFATVSFFHGISPTKKAHWAHFGHFIASDGSFAKYVFNEETQKWEKQVQPSSEEMDQPAPLVPDQSSQIQNSVPVPQVSQLQNSVPVPQVPAPNSFIPQSPNLYDQPAQLFAGNQERQSTVSIPQPALKNPFLAQSNPLLLKEPPQVQSANQERENDVSTPQVSLPGSFIPQTHAVLSDQPPQIQSPKQEQESTGPLTQVPPPNSFIARFFQSSLEEGNVNENPQGFYRVESVQPGESIATQKQEFLQTIPRTSQGYSQKETSNIQGNQENSGQLFSEQIPPVPEVSQMSPALVQDFPFSQAPGLSEQRLQGSGMSQLKQIFETLAKSSESATVQESMSKETAYAQTTKGDTLVQTSALDSSQQITPNYPASTGIRDTNLPESSQPGSLPSEKAPILQGSGMAQLQQLYGSLPFIKEQTAQTNSQTEPTVQEHNDPPQQSQLAQNSGNTQATQATTKTNSFAPSTVFNSAQQIAQNLAQPGPTFSQQPGTQNSPLTGQSQQPSDFVMSHIPKEGLGQKGLIKKGLETPSDSAEHALGEKGLIRKGLEINPEEFSPGLKDQLSEPGSMGEHGLLKKGKIDLSEVSPGLAAHVAGVAAGQQDVKFLAQTDATYSTPEQSGFIPNTIAAAAKKYYGF